MICPCGNKARTDYCLKCLKMRSRWKLAGRSVEYNYRKRVERINKKNGRQCFECKIDIGGAEIKGLTWLDKTQEDDEEMILVKLKTGWIPFRPKEVIITRSLNMTF